MNELVEYLDQLEKRIAIMQDQISDLKIENGNLRGLVQKRPILDEEPAPRPEQHFPKTLLLDKNFMTRAFAVWGHYFVAQLIISLVFLIFYLCFIFAIAGFSISSLTGN
jgi:hypothetical protein